MNYENCLHNNVTFVNGNSTSGGAIYWTGNNGNIVDSNFYNNTASSNGSAIYTEQTLNIENSEFIDNLANNTYSKIFSILIIK